ncbi:MAG: alpha/beta fold hydrolase, partial [Leptolyngbya sp.]|nr:alpha/beta fold hydrolase [Candidatus Melainabacteria bacterium]
MLNRVNIRNAALSTVMAVGLAALASPALADDPGTTALTAPDESGSKQLRLPSATLTSKATPSLSWLPADGVSPKVAVLCIHGFSLHKGCYEALGKALAKNGIAAYAMDLRGFGERKIADDHNGLDFDGDIVDVKAMIEQIHKNHPGVPVVVLGESMGGAIALRVAAFYPELVAGLISSVPARDRFAMSDAEKKVVEKCALQTVVGAYSKPMTDVAMAAVQKITDKPELRNEWKSDPMMRINFSPKDFVQLDGFLAHNLEAAARVKKTPVLFIQGTNDKLIRPAGTWKLFERLATPNRQMVLSKNSEHLIFEKGQFNSDDLKFVVSWIDKNVAPLDSELAKSKEQLPVVASMEQFSSAGTSTASSATGTSAPTETIASASIPNVLPPVPSPTEFQNRLPTAGRNRISYWIELYRGGKVYRCNNKMEFKTGDAIRFHLIPESDGYAYLVMKASTTGKSDVLFPNKEYGTHNFLREGQDYPIPSTGWMAFDSNAGTEQLGLVFGQEKIAVTPEMLRNGEMTAFVSPSQQGSKDLCPTRMKLSWDDPMPV